MIEQHIQFIDTVTRRKIEEITLGFIANSNIYTLGKNKNNEALLIISLKSKIKSSELEEFMSLIEVLFLVFRLKACIPGYHERFSVLIDLDKSTCSLIFFSNLLKKLRKFVTEQCPFGISTFYFYGVKDDYEPPLKTFEDSMRHMCKIKEFRYNNEGNIPKEAVMVEFDRDFLEKKFGGNLKNLEEFWPPRCLEDATKTIDETSLHFHHIIPFTYNPAEFRSYSMGTMNSISNSKKRSRILSPNFSLGNGSFQDLSTSNKFKLCMEENSTSSTMINTKRFKKRGTQKRSKNGFMMRRCKKIKIIFC